MQGNGEESLTFLPPGLLTAISPAFLAPTCVQLHVAGEDSTIPQIWPLISWSLTSVSLSCTTAASSFSFSSCSSGSSQPIASFQIPPLFLTPPTDGPAVSFSWEPGKGQDSQLSVPPLQPTTLQPSVICTLLPPPPCTLLCARHRVHGTWTLIRPIPGWQKACFLFSSPFSCPRSNIGSGLQTIPSQILQGLVLLIIPLPCPCISNLLFNCLSSAA